ncbi:MAG TPA: 3-deoxy-D-manno-octulosonic acid kinase [Marinobacter sp.]|nr:3-deoxy-D-manno-octulosonic acid kinase [Marinobacter sp.]
MGSACRQHVRATGGYLVARSFEAEFSDDWFNPEFWGERAVPVTAGGRGAAWFLRRESGDLVLRHFCRGGIPGRFLRRGYLFAGSDNVRSFAEFRLLEALLDLGLPVPEPVAAGYQRTGLLFYRAAIIIRRIPGARPLSEFCSAEHLDLWASAGACVRRFHDAGVFHADLNLMNILISDRVYLIDFDRGRLMPASRPADWRDGNIQRLERSVNKCLGDLESGLRRQLWGAFLQGYRNP